MSTKVVSELFKPDVLLLQQGVPYVEFKGLYTWPSSLGPYLVKARIATSQPVPEHESAIYTNCVQVFSQDKLTKSVEDYLRDREQERVDKLELWHQKTPQVVSGLLDLRDLCNLLRQLSAHRAGRQGVVHQNMKEGKWAGRTEYARQPTPYHRQDDVYLLAIHESGELLEAPTHLLGQLFRWARDTHMARLSSEQQPDLLSNAA